MSASSQRLDKWLYFARLLKTRTQASRLIMGGKIRVNKKKVVKPAHNIQEGDVITAVIHKNLRIVKVLEPGRRRGPATEAVMLFEDLTPIETKKDTSRTGKPPVAQPPAREKGSGRPTKRDRRKMDEFENWANESV